jgi:hypothetical protein
MMLEGVGSEGQVQVEYLAEQGLDLSKESGGLGSRKLTFFAQIFRKDDLSVHYRYFATTLSAVRGQYLWTKYL